MSYECKIAVSMKETDYLMLTEVIEAARIGTGEVLGVGNLISVPMPTREVAEALEILIDGASQVGIVSVPYWDSKTGNDSPVDVHYLVWDWRKWTGYDYPEVEWLESYIRSLSDYEYICLGEDLNDQSLEYCALYERVLDLSRQIVIAQG